MRRHDPALARLPHGPGFRFVDRVNDLAPGRSGTAEVRLEASHPILAAHFPGDPLVPGVILVEALAQLAGIVWGAAEEPSSPPARRFLAEVSRARFRRPVGPGETVVLSVAVEKRLGPLARFRGEARVGAAVVAEAEITLASR
ncbi:MAG: beta-hydroxyacyl-ACP dehydratase [Planctomycetales bacterium]|nr:beta-hydroxyacyl-ACP dehydratase [Planctomycetales bacterium]